MMGRIYMSIPVHDLPYVQDSHDWRIYMLILSNLANPVALRASIHAPMMRFLLATLILILACQFVFAQQTNPVDRKVANPMTDTPNVNPLQTDQPVQRRPAASGAVEAVA